MAKDYSVMFNACIVDQPGGEHWTTLLAGSDADSACVKTPFVARQSVALAPPSMLSRIL